MNDLLNSANSNLSKLAQELHLSYKNAQPFPNICIDQFFDPIFLDKVLDEFPDLSEAYGKKLISNNEFKFASQGEGAFGPNTLRLMHFLNSQPFLSFLQNITGIKETLIGDPYFIGGGLHEIKKGGFLKVHSDFNKHTYLKLDRRINLLIYLNKDWKDEYGGHFELWDKKMSECKKSIKPDFNRIAIFSTTDFSYHGHPDPLNCPEERSRKSIALYYYSTGRPDSEINIGHEDHSTIFKKRKGNKGDVNMSDYMTFKRKTKIFIKSITPPFVLKFFLK